MHTGKFPASHGLRRNGDPLSSVHATLAAQLKAQGYRTGGFASSLDRSRWNFWTRGFDVTADGTNGRMIEEANRPDGQWQWDQRVMRAAIEFVESTPADQPLFLWVHLFDAHGPYSPNPADAALFADPNYTGPLKKGKAAAHDLAAQIFRHNLGASELAAADLAYAKAMYHASIRGADSHLAQIAKVLEDRGRLRGAVRVFSADHGEDLGEHSRYYGHGNSIYDTTLRIPLIVVLPGAPRGKTSDALVHNLDLFPTLLRAVGIESPPDNEGIDLAGVMQGGPGRDVVFGELEGEIHTISDGKWKLVSNPTGLQPQDVPYSLTPDRGFPIQCRELYELERDPFEQVNLYAKTHPEAVRLLARLEEFLADPRHRRGAAEVANADEAALGALGYVSSATKKAPRIKCE
jgi:arylsulfatase A-like enzyme